jgi:hypothetical protein
MIFREVIAGSMSLFRTDAADDLVVAPSVPMPNLEAPRAVPGSPNLIPPPDVVVVVVQCDSSSAQ